MRVYEVAKTSGLTSKEIITLLQEASFDVASHMSVVSPEALVFLDKRLNKAPIPAEKSVPQAVAPEANAKPAAEKIEKKIETIPESKPSPVIAPSSENKHTIKKAAVSAQGKQPVIQQKVQQPLSKQMAVAPVVVEPFKITAMTVGDFAQTAKKPLIDVIMYLLKKGIVASKNQLITEEIVTDLATHYELVLATSGALDTKTQQRFQSVAGAVAEERLPVIVVIGHVDHGKTTFLDYVRKTRVAAREKGGITQHLGAYAVPTRHGSLVFLDTPGHEAFSLMRTRGIKAADIAILMVAADDGIMPQTVEAIKAAQGNNITIIVALNKIDKVSPAQIDKVKHSFAQYGLTPEEWGGTTVVMPISAKLGQGVDELLEVVSLQAQLMELSANPHVPAQGFVLESKFEKGLGPVATVICQQGTLRVGDYFTAGTVQGKVSALVDSAGARIKEVLPSIPVQVAGFDELPRAGDAFEVVTIEQYKKARQTAPVMVSKSRGAATENALNLIIKTDNVSSLEAVLGAITKLSGKAFKECNVLHGAVGALTESDISLAIDTKSLVYGFHTKVEPNAAILAQKYAVSIKLFDIIYKMIEDLEVVSEQGRPVKTVTKKIGEAVVLKVFDIKGLGVIAGAQVKSGIFARNGKVVIWRGRYKVGEGAIKSLQRDKKTVKEVHSGFECAFMVEGITDWLVDDRVECYLEVPEGSESAR